MRELESVLLECEYFPCIDWYRQYLRAPNVIIEKYEYFVRKTYRNRCCVAGPNGILTLSVPLEGGRNQRAVMKDIKVSDAEDWQTLHWKTIQSAYNRSAYFEYFAERLKQIFAKRYTYLMDLNLDTLQVINHLLAVKKEFELTTAYQAEYEENMNDERQTFFASKPISNATIKYTQTFEERHGFIGGLSMLDLILCTGKQAVDLLLLAEK